MNMIFYIFVMLFSLTVSATHAEEEATKPSLAEEITKNPVPSTAPADVPGEVKKQINDASQYTVGAEDILQVQTIQPEQLSITATVSPDGFISFPYIGNVKVRDKTLNQIQDEIAQRLTDGYMRYPIVVVTLQQSKSRKFFVYGEVNKPGAYPLEENTTVLRAVSMAGGFTKYGSSSRVKVLKPQTNGVGYETLKVDVDKVMKGTSREDPVLNSGDIVVVSEGIF
jgi:polysaccharide export outer membrane protein